MSAMIKEMVLRLPCERVSVDDPIWFAKRNAAAFDHPLTERGFRIAPTVRPFFDYVLESEGTSQSSYERTRALDVMELRDYDPLFRAVFPHVDLTDVRVVEYVWYDGTEAPSCYMPFIVKEIPVTDLIAVKEDPFLPVFLAELEEQMGRGSRFRIRFSGIAHVLTVFAEADTETLCEGAVQVFEQELQKKGYLRKENELHG